MMNNTIRTLLMLFAAFWLWLPTHAAAIEEGKDYVRLQYPQPTESADKVEVIEFFWYGCPHCAAFEPFLHKWLSRLPSDVHFRRVPAIFSPKWSVGARIYYALVSLGLEEQLNDAVFKAIAGKEADLGSEEALFDWIAQQGVDRKSFANAYKSFSVDSQVRKAEEMTAEYGFGGVPVMIVGGKYMPSARKGTYRDMLNVVDALVEKNRAEIGR